MYTALDKIRRPCGASGWLLLCHFWSRSLSRTLRIFVHRFRWTFSSHWFFCGLLTFNFAVSYGSMLEGICGGLLNWDEGADAAQIWHSRLFFSWLQMFLSTGGCASVHLLDCGFEAQSLFVCRFGNTRVIFILFDQSKCFDLFTIFCSDNAFSAGLLDDNIHCLFDR